MVMEKQQHLISFAEDGSVVLPVGYRFDPTDDVLVTYYLKRKIYRQPVPVPAQVIEEFDVFQTEPWKLPAGDRNVFKEKKYFFFSLRGRHFDNIDKRVAGMGEWRTVEKGKHLVLSNKEFIGHRNTLVFWNMRGNRAVKTRWMMQEFRLALTAHPTKLSAMCAYRIFQKKEAKKGKKGKGKKPSGSTKPTVIDLTVENGNVFGPPSPMTP